MENRSDFSLVSRRRAHYDGGGGVWRCAHTSKESFIDDVYKLKQKSDAYITYYYYNNTIHNHRFHIVLY